MTVGMAVTTAVASKALRKSPIMTPAVIQALRCDVIFNGPSNSSEFGGVSDSMERGL